MSRRRRTTGLLTGNRSRPIRCLLVSPLGPRPSRPLRPQSSRRGGCRSKPRRATFLKFRAARIHGRTTLRPVIARPIQRLPRQEKSKRCVSREVGLCLPNQTYGVRPSQPVNQFNSRSNRSKSKGKNGSSRSKLPPETWHRNCFRSPRISLWSTRWLLSLLSPAIRFCFIDVSDASHSSQCII